MAHQSNGNEVTPGGIVHRCSCGWVSRPCFSNMVASLEGQNHREAAAGDPGVAGRDGQTFRPADADDTAKRNDDLIRLGRSAGK